MAHGAPRIWRWLFLRVVPLALLVLGLLVAALVLPRRPAVDTLLAFVGEYLDPELDLYDEQPFRVPAHHAFNPLGLAPRPGRHPRHQGRPDRGRLIDPSARPRAGTRSVGGSA